MNNPYSNGPVFEPAGIQDRRIFLKGIGKWSGAAIVAAVAGSMVGTAPDARAGAWINGGGGGGGWINRRSGGGGSWVNRR